MRCASTCDDVVHVVVLSNHMNMNKILMFFCGICHHLILMRDMLQLIDASVICQREQIS